MLEKFLSAISSEQNHTTTYVVNTNTLLYLKHNRPWRTIKHRMWINGKGQFLLKIRTFSVSWRLRYFKRLVRRTHACTNKRTNEQTLFFQTCKHLNISTTYLNHITSSNFKKKIINFPSHNRHVLLWCHNSWNKENVLKMQYVTSIFLPCTILIIATVKTDVWYSIKYQLTCTVKK